MYSHSKKDLIHLAPRHMLSEHVSKIGLPDFIQEEIWEQQIFWSNLMCEERCNWTKNQWVDWYEYIVQMER